MNEKNEIVVIMGNSGSGKSTFEKMVRDRLGYLNTISATTRNPRVGELHGKDYFFYNKQDFVNKVMNDEFVEYVEYAGNYYGTLRVELDNKLNNGNVVCVLEPIGASSLFDKYKERVKLFYVKVDESILKERMISRGDSLESFLERLELDKVFETQIKELPYETIYNNGDIEESFLEIKKRLYSNTK